METITKIKSVRANTKMQLTHNGGSQFTLWYECDGDRYEHAGEASSIACEIDESFDDPTLLQKLIIERTKTDLRDFCKQNNIPSAYLGV